MNPLTRHRPRRLRGTAAVRGLVAETSLSVSHLVQPYFLKDKGTEKEPIDNFTGVSRWTIDGVSRRIENDLRHGVSTFLLFAKATTKDARGSAASAPDSLLGVATKELKKRFGTAATVLTDVCLCPFTDHGHCGILHKGKVANDESVAQLVAMALAHARAGVDFVAPSDMMDGRIRAIRAALDEAGFTETGIVAYAAKYASSYYGPFREALESSPAQQENVPSDRATYQMDYRNKREALREVTLDIDEGADIVLVKPALAYLDIIAEVRRISSVPVMAYSVSGEYEMVERMAAAGLADRVKLALENLFAIRRAGADSIVTYFASEAAEKGWLR